MKNASTYTLEEIHARRNELRLQIARKEKSIKDKTDALFSPPESGNKAEMYMNRAVAAYNAVDGFMTGYKLLKSLSFLFKRFKKKK